MLHAPSDPLQNRDCMNKSQMTGIRLYIYLQISSVARFSFFSNLKFIKIFTDVTLFKKEIFVYKIWLANSSISRVYGEE